MKPVVAVSANDVIGKTLGESHIIPWKIPSDLKRFSTLTQNCIMVCGHTTYKSLPRGLNLSDRKLIVLTRTINFQTSDPRVTFVNSYAEVMEIIKDNLDNVAIIGGSEVYALFLEHCDEVNITYIDVIIEDGTAYFPTKNFKSDPWKMILTHVSKGPNDEYQSVFVQYKRT